MQFLKNKGFTNDEIKMIIDKYDSDTINTFLESEDNVVEVIDYLNDFGIIDVPKLMLQRIDIFYIPVSKISELFSHYEKDSIIKALDYDASIFDEMK